MNSCTFVNHVDQEPPTCVWVWNGLAAGNACHCSSCVEYERARGGEQVRNGMSPSSQTTTFLRTTIHQRETVFGSRWFHASYPSVRLDFRVVFSQRTETETRTRTETTHGATENTWDTWVGAIASTTDSVDARRPRRRYYAKRERKANWTERRSLRSFGSCVFALVPLSPATRTATTTTPTPTPTPLVATMARRRNRRPKRPHLARFSTNILSFSQPLSLSLSSPTFLSYFHPSRSLARSFPLSAALFPFSRYPSLSNRPRHLLVPLSRACLLLSLSPLLYRSYRKSPVPRSICFSRLRGAEATNRALSRTRAALFLKGRWKESICRQPICPFPRFNGSPFPWWPNVSRGSAAEF